MSIKILVVDDEEEVRKVIKVLLKQTGYDILEASKAQEAFQLLRKHGNEIKVVICDLKIPEISGVQVLERIKLEFDTLPVVVLTGMVDLKVAVEAMKKGAFDFLTKPTKKEDLILVIEKALNYKKTLDNYRDLQQRNLEYRRSIEKVLDQKAKELEITSIHVAKIREDLLNLKIVP